MRKVLMVILILGVIVAPDTATSGGGKYRDYICLAPGVDGPDGRVVYEVVMVSRQPTELTIEAIDCCLPGDTWRLVAKMKKPIKKKEKIIFSGDGGYSCCAIGVDKTITFSADLQKKGEIIVEIIVEPIEVAVSYPASALVRLNWNRGWPFTVTIKEGTDYCLE